MGPPGSLVAQPVRDRREGAPIEARAFVTRQLPLLYQQGAQSADAAVGGRFTGTLLHTEALSSLAADSYADFL